MGLDVSLKYCTNFADAKARETLGSEREDALWEGTGGYEKTTDAQRNEIRAKTKAIYKELNLDEYGSSEDITSIEMDSTKHPEHMFKVGYLRSSYNSGGINSVLKRIDCNDLYDIFQPGDEYSFTPDWAGAQARVDDAIAALAKHMTSEMSKYDVVTITDLMGTGGVKDAGEALAVFKQQLETRAPNSFKSYGCREGDFYLDGLTVCGIIPNRGFGGGVHLITRNDSEESNLKWYFEALEVTKEMIDYVLAQKDPENYYLNWSA